MGNSETKLVFAEMLLPTSSAQQLYAVYDDTYVASTTLLNIYANAAPHSWSNARTAITPHGSSERQASSYQASCCLSTQGHAGTVPMAVRRDPLTAAAEAINMIEQQCGGGQLAGMMQTMPHGKQAAQSVLDPSLVCTVGTLSVWPGASNVIAGSTNFSVDIRQVNACLRKHMVHSHPRINLFACFQTSNTSWLSL